MKIAVFLSIQETPYALSPKFLRRITNLYLDQSEIGGVFFDENYDKFALFYNNGTVYTFDHQLFTLPNMTPHDDGTFEKPGQPKIFGLSKGIADKSQTYDMCTYLLTRDVQNQHFSVYYRPYSNDFINIIYHGVSLTLSQKGQIKVNGTIHDLPLEDLNG